MRLPPIGYRSVVRLGPASRTTAPATRPASIYRSCYRDSRRFADRSPNWRSHRGPAAEADDPNRFARREPALETPDRCPSRNPKLGWRREPADARPPAQQQEWWDSQARWRRRPSTKPCPSPNRAEPNPAILHAPERRERHSPDGEPRRSGESDTRVDLGDRQ